MANSLNLWTSKHSSAPEYRAALRPKSAKELPRIHRPFAFKLEGENFNPAVGPTGIEQPPSISMVPGLPQEVAGTAGAGADWKILKFFPPSVVHAVGRMASP